MSGETNSQPVWITTKRKCLNHINLQDNAEYEAEHIILKEKHKENYYKIEQELTNENGL